MVLLIFVSYFDLAAAMIEAADEEEGRYDGAERGCCQYRRTSEVSGRNAHVHFDRVVKILVSLFAPLSTFDRAELRC